MVQPHGNGIPTLLNLREVICLLWQNLGLNLTRFGIVNILPGQQSQCDLNKQIQHHEKQYYPANLLIYKHRAESLTLPLKSLKLCLLAQVKALMDPSLNSLKRPKSSAPESSLCQEAPTRNMLRFSFSCAPTPGPSFSTSSSAPWRKYSMQCWTEATF